MPTSSACVDDDDDLELAASGKKPTSSRRAVLDADDVELSKKAGGSSSASSSTELVVALAASCLKETMTRQFAIGLIIGSLLMILIILPSLSSSPAPNAATVRRNRVVSAVNRRLSLLESRGFAGVLYLNETLSMDLLRYSDFGASSSSTPLQQYLSLSRGFDAQKNQAYCGLASAATVLNSLIYPVDSLAGAGAAAAVLLDSNIDLDLDPIYKPYAYATQADILGECTAAKYMHRDSDYDSIMLPPYGSTLLQIGGILSCHLSSLSNASLPPDSEITWSVTSTPLDPALISLASFRSTLVSALSSSPLSRVLVNFHRAPLGQLGGGHWSPLSGYDAGSDSFLLLDVAKYKLPSAFVRASALYGALATVDDCGTWRWPDAQALLTSEERGGGPMTQTVKDKLGCKKS